MSKDMQTANQPVILQYLDRFKDQIAVALPKHLTADRMARIVTTEVRKVPQLLQCDPKSLFGAVIQASQLGLEPGGALGHCYLIPFKRDVQLIIGYRGMIDLARRSGQIISIEARAVYEQDQFAYSFGLNPDLKHTPAEGGNKGKLTHVYAVARLKDGGLQWDVMPVAEIEEIRKQSKAGNSGPWKTHYDEMAKKTVIRRLFKYLPVSVEVQQAVGLDEQTDAGIPQRNDALIEGEFMTLDDTPAPEPETKTAAVKDKIRNQSGPVADGVPVGDGPTYAQIAEQINTAKTQDDVDVAMDLANALDDAGQVEELHGLAAGKLKELGEAA